MALHDAVKREDGCRRNVHAGMADQNVLHRLEHAQCLLLLQAGGSGDPAGNVEQAPVVDLPAVDGAAVRGTGDQRLLLVQGGKAASAAVGFRQGSLQTADLVQRAFQPPGPRQSCQRRVVEVPHDLLPAMPCRAGAFQRPDSGSSPQQSSASAYCAHSSESW